MSIRSFFNYRFWWDEILRDDSKSVSISQHFCCANFLRFNFCSFIFDETLMIVKQWAKNKITSKRLSAASYIFILPDLKHYNSNILSKQSVNTCVLMCKSACANKLKPHFLTFPTSLSIMWQLKHPFRQKIVFCFIS